MNEKTKSMKKRKTYKKSYLIKKDPKIKKPSGSIGVAAYLG